MLTPSEACVKQFPGHRKSNPENPEAAAGRRKEQIRRPSPVQRLGRQGGSIGDEHSKYFLRNKVTPRRREGRIGVSTAERSGRARSGKSSPAEPRDWEEVNQRLSYLGEVERQIRGLQDQFQEKVAVLKQQWLEASQPVERERERLQRQIERFFWAHRSELASQGRKSVELAFGRLGVRLSRSVIVEDETAAQQWLAAHGLERFLRTRTEVDREAVRATLLAAQGLPDEPARRLLVCPAIHLREVEQFWCQVHRDEWGLSPHTKRSPAASNPSRRERNELPVENRHCTAVG